MGDCAALERFVKGRYIWASRMTGNTTPSRMKLVCRDYLGNMLVNEFPDWQILPDSSLPADSNVPFDIVATSPSGRAFAIEVIFCYATERTLEQKAKLADVHAALAHKAGHRIVHVIANPRDIKRISALSAICRNSDCTVAFTPKDLNGLVEFLHIESEQAHA